MNENKAKLASPVNSPSQSSNLPAAQKKYAAAYVSYVSRAIGYSYGHYTQEQASRQALDQCRKLATSGNTDQCILVASGQGQCIAISRAPNGAVGVDISDSPLNSGAVSLSVCKQNGGGNSCSNPSQLTSCSN